MMHGIAFLEKLQNPSRYDVGLIPTLTTIKVTGRCYLKDFTDRSIGKAAADLCGHGSFIRLEA